MDLQFSFNGTIVNHPDNWQDFQAIIERSEDFLGLVNRYTSELTFTGDAYDAIVTSIQNNGFCTPITTLVQIRPSPDAAWIDLIEGVIFPVECNFDRTQCTVRAEINDNSYVSKIENNQKIKAHIEVPRSKNDVTITAATSKSADFFTPSTGAYNFTNRISYTVDEVLKFLVAFMTDGTVDYVSTAFGLGGDYQFWLISAGQEVREGGGVLHPYLSFYEVIQELNKKTPIGFGIEDNGGTPRIRIEKKEYFRNEAVTGFDARSIRGLQMTFRENEIYSKVKFGGTNTQTQDGVFQYPDIPFFNFKEEEYHLLGECNVENELDLVGNWIVDSNVIEDILINNNDDYDEDIVLFTADLGGSFFEAIQYAYFNEEVYNIPLNNQGVAERYIGFIPTSIAQYLGVTGGGATGFHATRSIPTSHTLDNVTPTYNEEPAETDTIISNDGNYTGSPDFRYTAPATGYYNLESWVSINITAIDPGVGLQITVIMKRFDAANVLLESISHTESRFVTGPRTIEREGELILNATDYVHIRYEFAILGGVGADAVSFDITLNSVFFSRYIYALGGVVQEYDPEDFHIYNFQADGYPMSLTEYLALFADPSGVFNLNTGSDTTEDIITFADQIIYRPFTGTADLRTFGKYNGF